MSFTQIVNAGHRSAMPQAGAAPTVAEYAAMESATVLSDLDVIASVGLSAAEAAHRVETNGLNALRSHRARPLAVLGHQLRSALLILLFVTAAISFVLGERADAVIITVILAASIGLGFVNEYRAEKATEALHSSVRHLVVVIRDGHPSQTEVTQLVPGDIVCLALGGVVPADVRLLETVNFECDEGVLTGESLPTEKSETAVASGLPLAELSSVAFMGTIVSSGSATGVVVGTAARTEFGKVAAGLGGRQPETDFQLGLRQFSMLLLRVALVLSCLILVTNLFLHRSFIDSVLFSLAIAVGITPQLLPAVVSTSLATGSRHLAAKKVLVKRLVCIEDLGDMDVLVTDKTGTLTEGTLAFQRGIDANGSEDPAVARLGLLASDVDISNDAVVGGNPLDTALWQGSDHRAVAAYRRRGSLPFDHERRMSSVVVTAPDGTDLLVVKGAPESVLAACADLPAAAATTLEGLFGSGARVVAVASRSITGVVVPRVSDEQCLTLVGFLVFVDPPKASAAASLRRLGELGIDVKIATGDNSKVAEKICSDLGLPVRGVLDGPDIDKLDDESLVTAAQQATIFARISPEQKARLVRALRRKGRSVGFLGDGVNDALALHAADIGISVDSATDVAKDAADVVLLETSLDVLADGVAEGRRIFTNTIKYVLMGTSSNFGNMFSAAAASGLLKFLPMLPSQILLNNLLYDSSQLTIPTDRVDEEQLAAPSHWDIAFIRRFMMLFGPISSLFDFMTFGLMIGGFHAGADLFRSGWFVESLATQTLILFAIRTRRSPFYRSRPSMPLVVAALAVVTIGIALPLSPLAHVLGFTAPPVLFYLALAGMVVAYFVAIEVAKKAFYSTTATPTVRRRGRTHRIHRRAARFSAA